MNLYDEGKELEFDMHTRLRLNPFTTPDVHIASFVIMYPMHTVDFFESNCCRWREMSICPRK